MSSAMVLLFPMILLITSDKAVSEEDCNRSVNLLLLFVVLFSLMTTHPYITLNCILFVFKTKFCPPMLLQPVSKWDNWSMYWYVQTTLFCLNIFYSRYFERMVPCHALKQQDFSVSSIWKKLWLSYLIQNICWSFFCIIVMIWKMFNFLLFRKYTK